LVKPIATFLTVVVCFLAITAAALDVHCGLVAPAGDTVVLVCRAGRMP